jgi:hypothetical protein
MKQRSKWFWCFSVVIFGALTFFWIIGGFESASQNVFGLFGVVFLVLSLMRARGKSEVPNGKSERRSVRTDAAND